MTFIVYFTCIYLGIKIESVFFSIFLQEAWGCGSELYCLTFKDFSKTQVLEMRIKCVVDLTPHFSVTILLVAPLKTFRSFCQRAFPEPNFLVLVFDIRRECSVCICVHACVCVCVVGAGLTPSSECALGKHVRKPEYGS